MNARMLTQTLISAAVGGIAALTLTGSPLSAQQPEATPTPSANSTPESTVNQHQQHQEMMDHMQQMKEKCKSMMSHGMMGSDNAHTEGQQGEHGQGSTHHNTDR